MVLVSMYTQWAATQAEKGMKLGHKESNTAERLSMHTHLLRRECLFIVSFTQNSGYTNRLIQKKS